MREFRKKCGASSRRPKRRQRLLRVERLEERLALDSQGALVGFDPHFTLSFAADGVAIARQVNALTASFNAVAPEAVWREQILRAFQTWAIHTNADIGVVSDGGQAFGSPGATQRDDRFGDIRIGAIAASPEVGAVSVPVDNFVSGTWLADVLFNTQFGYQSADEILAVAMHEAGNVFGLDDSTDPNSPLFTGGPPTVKNPTAADIAALQALHGSRAPDLNEATGNYTDNDSFTTATRLKLADAAGGEGGSAPTIVYGDVGSSGDVDFFYIETPGDYTGPVTFQLRSSGISLLQPDLTIYDAAQQPLEHLFSQDVGGAVLTVQLPGSTPQHLFYVRVAGADPERGSAATGSTALMIAAAAPPIETGCQRDSLDQSRLSRSVFADQERDRTREVEREALREERQVEREDPSLDALRWERYSGDERRFEVRLRQSEFILPGQGGRGRSHGRAFTSLPAEVGSGVIGVPVHR